MFQTPAPRGGVPLGGDVILFNCEATAFQTPAPRGGVPLVSYDLRDTFDWPSFKPLRLGAVFLCSWARGVVRPVVGVSNPCASGRCSSAYHQGETVVATPNVSNPCASGRCSSVAFLGRSGGEPSPGCFKPLRLGAVFLCQLPGQQLRHGGRGFKPLRLGAVFLCLGDRCKSQWCSGFKPLRLGAVFLWYKEGGSA